MYTGKLASQAFCTLVQNHTTLSGNCSTKLESACEIVFLTFSRDPLSILGSICEQLPKTMKTLRRSPYLNVAQWIDERAPSSVND
jgi:hypothetical protein